jgi:hypothetical protein
MNIQALGGCCKKSQTNYENAVKAAQAAGLKTAVEHITDPEAILALGVLSTPGIVIDGKVMSTGRSATVAQILEMIAKRKPLAAETVKTECCEGDDCDCENGKCDCVDGKCVCEDGKCVCENGKCDCVDGECACPPADDCCGHGKK